VIVVTEKPKIVVETGPPIVIVQGGALPPGAKVMPNGDIVVIEDRKKRNVINPESKNIWHLENRARRALPHPDDEASSSLVRLARDTKSDKGPGGCRACCKCDGSGSGSSSGVSSSDGSGSSGGSVTEAPEVVTTTTGAPEVITKTTAAPEVVTTTTEALSSLAPDAEKKRRRRGAQLKKN